MAGRRGKKEEPNAEEILDGMELADVQVSHDRQVRSLRADKRELEAKNGSLLRQVEELERENDTYTRILNYLPAVKPIRPRKRSKAHSESTALVLASDWHVEELVEPSTVGGRNRYNPDIAKARSQRFFQSTLRLVEMWRGHTEIKNLVLWLGGDFITGHIHEENKETTAMSPIQAIEFAIDLLKPGITFLLEHGKFERIVIPCSFGNHGRLTKRPYYSRAAHHNLEWQAYTRLADFFRSEKRIQFSVTEARFLDAVEVYGRRLRFHHGEEIRYQGGQQGLYGGLFKKHRAWNVNRECYMTCVGHWHQAQSFQDLGMVNGSLIGPSAYSAMLSSPMEPARQMACLIEKERGMTLSGPVYVE